MPWVEITLNLSRLNNGYSLGKSFPPELLISPNTHLQYASNLSIRVTVLKLFITIYVIISKDTGKEMIEIQVTGNLEKAMRALKRKLIREGMFRELKARRFYEKPSEKAKRKSKEAQKKRRKETERMRRFSY